MLDLGGRQVGALDQLDWMPPVKSMGPAEDYTEWSIAGAPQRFAGMLQLTAEWGELPSYWSLYLKLADPDAIAAAATQVGGKVVVGPFNAPGVGRLVLLQDPTGATFYIIHLTLAGHRTVAGWSEGGKARLRRLSLMAVGIYRQLHTAFMGIIASDMRRGMAIMFNGEPCRVLEFHHHTPGNLRAMVQAKLRRLKTGIQVEHRFRSTDTVEVAALETHELDFMYRSGDTYHFMNAENYDQLEVDGETLGESAKWMAEGMRIIAEWYDGRPIGIQLPSTLTLEVVDTAPTMKTATKTASNKPAKLSNGVTVNVPEFVQTGEKVRVNPETGEYIERAK